MRNKKDFIRNKISYTLGRHFYEISEISYAEHGNNLPLGQKQKLIIANKITKSAR